MGGSGRDFSAGATSTVAETLKYANHRLKRVPTLNSFARTRTRETAAESANSYRGSRPLARKVGRANVRAAMKGEGEAKAEETGRGVKAFGVIVR